MQQLTVFLISFLSLMLIPMPPTVEIFVPTLFSSFAYAFSLAAIYEPRPSQHCMSKLLCGGDDTKRFLFTVLFLMVLLDRAPTYLLHKVPSKYFDAFGALYGLCYLIFTFSAAWNSYRLCNLFMICNVIFAWYVH